MAYRERTNLRDLTMDRILVAERDAAQVARTKTPTTERDRREREIIAASRVIEERIPIGDYNFRELRDRLREDYLNPRTMMEVQRLFQTLVAKGHVSTHRRLMEYVSNLSVIGEPGAYGIAASGGIGNQPETRATRLGVVKAPLDKSGEVDFLHEYFVGYYGANYMRQLVPNFAMVYACFRCSAPLVSLTSSELIEFGSGEGDVPHIIYEDIFDAVTLYDVLEDPAVSFTEKVGYLVQTIAALDLGYREREITHYDAHPGNVLVRKLPSSRPYLLVDYRLGDEEAMRIGKIATLIDYGCSHVRYGGEHFGVHHLVAYGVLPDRGNVAHDIYKLVMFATRHLIAAASKAAPARGACGPASFSQHDSSQSSFAPLVAHAKQARDLVYHLFFSIMDRAEYDRRIDSFEDENNFFALDMTPEAGFTGASIIKAIRELVPGVDEMFVRPGIDEPHLYRYCPDDVTCFEDLNGEGSFAPEAALTKARREISEKVTRAKSLFNETVLRMEAPLAERYLDDVETLAGALTNNVCSHTLFMQVRSLQRSCDFVLEKYPELDDVAGAPPISERSPTQALSDEEVRARLDKTITYLETVIRDQIVSLDWYVNYGCFDRREGFLSPAEYRRMGQGNYLPMNKRLRYLHDYLPQYGLRFKCRLYRYA
jgi:hypothetical protein